MEKKEKSLEEMTEEEMIKKMSGSHYKFNDNKKPVPKATSNKLIDTLIKNTSKIKLKIRLSRHGLPASRGKVICDVKAITRSNDEDGPTHVKAITRSNDEDRHTHVKVSYIWDGLDFNSEFAVKTEADLDTVYCEEI
jgi:hypothetical protein